MIGRALTLLLSVGFLASLGAWLPQAVAVRLPGQHTGYEPVQPIAFSHRLHAGELSIRCTYCHWAAERSRHAGIPAASICMNCHRTVQVTMAGLRAEVEAAEREGRDTQPVSSPELQKLYASLGLGEGLEPDPALTPAPVPWIQVHALGDYVYFDHRAHVGVGVRCQTCHGPVETMERVRQVGTLSMGWCVNCHRDATEQGIDGRQVHASLDCSTCHR
ncbi:MAG: hypothetical protein FJW23_05765 [Acidimicrobiia bacterium]|nr:hypothetical protein [Acidimicrobiia bacterium]